MLLELELGYNRGVPVAVTWNKSIDDFPKFLKYQGSAWEWVMYDKGIYPVDWTLNFAEIPTYDANYWKATVRLEDLMGSRHPGNKCECGSQYTSFPSLHLFYCPMWKKF